MPLTPDPVLPLAPPPGGAQLLNGGCWLINLTTLGQPPRVYDGTMRIDRDATHVTASGDLYRRPGASAGSPPAVGTTVPIFPRDDYSRYIRVVGLEEHLFPQSARLDLEIWGFYSNNWVLPDIFKGSLDRMPPPSHFPVTADYFAGNLTRADGASVVRFSMGWVTSHLRKVTVEIDSVAGCEQPADNGGSFDWQKLFDDLNWDGTVIHSDHDVAEPSTGEWSDGELHAAMLARRDRNDLDAEWWYHMLSVGLIAGSPRGTMYDPSGSDVDPKYFPRQGCAIAARWPVPATPEWGLAAGERFGLSSPAFFRTAVHELGHAFGLGHNPEDLGFMNTTDVIADRGTSTTPFPNNIGWAFSPSDLRKLRHMPDALVRPGGAPLGALSGEDASPLHADDTITPVGLALTVTPLRSEVPIGAPVRVGIALVNKGEETQTVPKRISLKTEFVRGRVIDPSGTAREFRTLIGCVEDRELRELHPGDDLAYDLTLLRGPQGALFPAPGLYRIIVELRWTKGTEAIKVASEASLFVTGTRSKSHAAAAHRVLAAPELHLVLALGGSHLPEGLAALKAALADRVLRPHYVAIDARRRALMGLTQKRLAKSAVLSRSEETKLKKLAVLASEKTGRLRPPTLSTSES